MAVDALAGAPAIGGGSQKRAYRSHLQLTQHVTPILSLSRASVNPALGLFTV